MWIWPSLVDRSEQQDMALCNRAWMSLPLTLAAVVREDGENKEDYFGGRAVATHTSSGFQWGF